MGIGKSYNIMVLVLVFGSALVQSVHGTAYQHGCTMCVDVCVCARTRVCVCESM